MFCLTYACIYDMTQLFQQGCDYFLDMWNYSDQLHIWGGFLTIYYQFVYEGDSIPRTPECQLTMFISAIMMLIKTFFYLRIFKSLTKLVIMIKKVVNDLFSFLIFFFIQIVIFSVIYGILAVNNYKSEEDENILSLIKRLNGEANTD